MEENCVILGLNENEVELELGLSIGGSFKRIEKLKPFKKDQIRNRTPDSGVSEEPQPLAAAAEQECAAAAADPQRKREIQAMRRQEAKKKREEKQQKRGLSCIGQKNRCRSRDSVEQPECKKTKVEFSGSSDGETKSANLNSVGAPTAGHNVDPNSAFCSVIPVQVPCPYPYPQVQYGFGKYPCGTTGTLPCWSGVSGGNDRNAGQQAANQGFRPFKGSQNSGSGFDSDPNSSCTRDERNKKSGSNGSAVCSSPLLSDLQSSSNQGGSSNDIGPNSSIGCQPDHPAPATGPSTGPKCQLEETATSHQTDYSTLSTNDSSTKPNDHHTEAVSADNSNSKEEPAAEPEHKKPLIVKDDSNIVDSENKPPPPPPSSLPYMPCVSTTGDGPNGRTVNGFLYRYSQTEVSIVCVCHGSSFSPAEFVKHAGGTGVLQPLRHITVIPSAF